MEEAESGNNLMLYKILGILIGAFLLFVIPNIGMRVAKGDISNEIIISKDLALQIDTLHSLNGDAYIKNDGLSDYTIEFKNKKVTVYKGTKDIIKPSYGFLPTDNNEIERTFFNPTEIYTIKKGEHIYVDDKLPDFSVITCPSVMIPETTKLGIDPLKDEEDPDDILFYIANELSTHYDNSQFSRDLEGYVLRPEVLSKVTDFSDSDIIITIKYEEYEKTQNNLNVYYISGAEKTQQNKKIACNVLSKLIKTLGIEKENSFLVPISKDSAEEYKGLYDNKIIVIVELYNKNNENALENIKSKKIGIVGAIDEGIKESFT